MDERAAAIEQIYHARYIGFRRAVAAVLGDYDRAHDAVQDGFGLRENLRRTDHAAPALVPRS